MPHSDKRKKIRFINKILSIKISQKRFNQMKSGLHFEFRKVVIPLNVQQSLQCGDRIYANNPDGESKALEFLSADKQKGYSHEQIDIIVRVL